MPLDTTGLFAARKKTDHGGAGDELLRVNIKKIDGSTASFFQHGEQIQKSQAIEISIHDQIGIKVVFQCRYLGISFLDVFKDNFQDVCFNHAAN